MPSFIDKAGAQQQVTLSADLYRAAKDANLSVRQYINTQYPSVSDTDSFTQMCASEGLFFKANDPHAVRSTPMSVLLDPANVVHGRCTADRPCFCTGRFR